MKGREMEYRVRVWSAMHEHVVPLRYVAEAMARHAATGYGTLTLHWPTLKNLRPIRAELLLDAAMSGQLTVCDSQGRIASATELVETARASAAELAGDASEAPIDAENILPFLHAKRQHLIEWGKASGDVFLFVETPGTVVDSDLRNFTEAGYGEVIEPGYHRSFAGGGESEPWRDDLYVTAPGTTSQEQNTAAPAPVAVEKKEPRQDRRLQACEDDGLVMPRTYAGRLPDGVGIVAGREGVSRQAFSTDVKAALKRRESAIKEGGTVHRP